MYTLNKENIGLWFLPSNPKNKLSGTLTINEDHSCELEIAFDFNGLEGFEIEKLPIILGVLSNGKKVTLINPTKHKTTLGFPGFPVFKWLCTNTLIGNHYHNLSEIKLLELKVTYDHLDLWLDNSPFKIYKLQDSNDIQVQYKMPDLIKIEHPELNIEFTYKANINTNSHNNLVINQNEFVKFIFHQEITYEQMLEEVNDFANFLTLCIGDYVNFKQITAKDSTENEIIVLTRKEISNKNIREHEIIIKYPLIATTFDTFYKSWRKKKDLLSPIIHYFVEAHEKMFHIPLSFLKIVQAVEAFSRRMRANKIWSEEEYLETLERLTVNIENPEDKEFVKGLISNEPRLRQRLHEIFKEVNDIFEINSKNRGTLSFKIVNTRNYYTHFDQRLVNDILDDSSIFYTTNLLKIVLRVVLLRELGINNEIIKERMNENQELIHVKSGLGFTKPIQMIKVSKVENFQN